MRLFFYYFLHTAKNQLRKLLRTWVLVVGLVLLAAGGVAGYALRWYFHRLSAADALLPESVAEFFEVINLTPLNLVELAVGFLVLGILVIQAVSAERSVSRLFLQADVNLMFASDLSPQAVLSFRVLTTLGTAVGASLLLCVQLPGLVARLGLSPFAALSIPAAWCLTLGFSVLFKILIYELGSLHPFFHRNLRWFLFAALGVVGLVFYRFYLGTPDRALFEAAHRFFNAPVTRFIPVWGWIKGGLLFALEGNAPMSVALLCLNLALLALLTLAVRRIPADYYEETLSRAQELAMLMEAVNSEDAELLVTAPKRRRHGLRRDGFRFGSGASVYFHKVLYNRLRFSRLGFITKTMVTYLIAAIATGLYDRAFLADPLRYLPALVLSVMAFFRTIVTPVAEDLRKASFLMQPEPIWRKLFFSLLGGSCCCALDAAIPLMAGSAAAGFSPLAGLAYLPVLVSVDFFASAAGAFVDVSIPGAIGVSLKQIIQILLLYVGLIFDGMVLAYGISTRHAAAGFALVTALNLLFGGTFLGLAGVWLYPCKGRPPRSDDDVPDTAATRQAFTWVGLSLTFMYLAIHLGQYGLSLALPGSPNLAVYLPIYGFGLPVFLLLMNPRQVLAMRRRARERACALHLRQLLALVPICFFVMYAGNLLGYLLQGIVRLAIPFSVPRLAAASPTSEHLGLQAALLVIAAPVMEEFVFRRCVIERLLPYGERTTLLCSALLFGLFHEALNQAVYAFLLGLVFGFVYIKTRRLRYSTLLHLLINGMTTLALPALLTLAAGAAPHASPSQVELAAVLTEPAVLALLIYLLMLFVLSLVGAVLFAFAVREQDLSPDGIPLKTALTSGGMLVFLAMAGALHR